MRLAAVALALVLSSAASAAEITRVWASWHPASHFESLSEHFTGTEATGRELLFRSKPEARDGFYLLVRVGTKTGAPAKAVLEVVAPDQHRPVAYSWDLPTQVRSSQVYQFGVTGSDWPHPSREALAWRLRLLDGSGQELAVRRSFLWSAEPAP